MQCFKLESGIITCALIIVITKKLLSERVVNETTSIAITFELGMGISLRFLALKLDLAIELARKNFSNSLYSTFIRENILEFFILARTIKIFLTPSSRFRYKIKAYNFTNKSIILASQDSKRSFDD